METQTAKMDSGPEEHFFMRYVLMITTVAALGGLLFGYDWVVIGGARAFYESYFRLTSERLIGWANSCALLGCLAGALLSGVLSDRYGRKALLIGAAFLFTVSSLATGWSYTFLWFILWRIGGGVAIGVASAVSPTYIAEVSPAPWRGRMVAVNQLGIGLGVLLAQVVNYLIAQKVPPSATTELIHNSWNGQFGWRWMFSAVAIPSIIFFAGSIFLPESPRWLVANGRRDRARRVLTKIGGENYADCEVHDIQDAMASSDAGQWIDLLRPR